MIRELKQTDRNKIERILSSQVNFSKEEVEAGMEVIDDCLEQDQEDFDSGIYFETFVDVNSEVDPAAMGAGVYIESEVINGFVMICKRPLTDGTFDLYWIAVNPEIHSKGIGTKLIQYAEQHIRTKHNGKLIVLETSGRPGYIKERAFYEKNGYQIFADIKDFYHEGDSLVIFGKYLK